ncbi:MFS transporter [Kamptonema cortianum]|jgi:sugar phosphate permease|nr:MFS transporter [Kamptonema cortianum]
MTSVLAKNATQKARKDSFLSDVRAWFIWSFAGLFYLYQFILRNSPGVMTDDLMRDFSVEACSLGILSSFYLVSYVSLQIPVGLGMDKFGPTRLLKGAILLCMIGTIVFAISDSFYLACFGRLLIGAGSTCAFLGSLKLATNWFHAERLALVVGFTLLAGKLGASFGQAPLAFVIDALGWREALLYVVVPIGVLIGGGIWIFVKDTPPEGPIEPVVSVVDTSLKTLFSRLKDITVDYRIWALGLYGALMYVPILAFIDLWGIPFLMKLYDVDRVVAASVTTMFYVGAGIGSPVVALISDYLMNRKLPMAVGAMLAIICNIAIIYLMDVPLGVMYVLLFLSGVFFAAQPLIFSSVCQLTPHASNGTAVSFTNMIVMIVGMVLQPLIGWFLDWIWDGVMNNGIPLYSIADYRFALLSVPVCLLISLLLVPLIPETFPREKKAEE